MNGIYLLCDCEEVVYVGKSTAINGRLSTHKASDKLFDSVVILEINNVADMHILELVLINKYKPKYNIDSKAEDEMTIKISMPNIGNASITEYVDGKLSEDNIIKGSAVVAELRAYLSSIEDNEYTDTNSFGFKLSVLQKTATAVLVVAKKRMKAVTVMGHYGVKPASYKLLHRYFDSTNIEHIKLLEDIIEGNSLIKSIPECVSILKGEREYEWKK